MPTSRRLSPIGIGFLPAIPNNALTTFFLNAASPRGIALGIYPAFNGTLTSFSLYLASLTGGGGAAADYLLNIDADSTTTPGTPGTSLGSATQGGVPTAPGWVDWTGLSIAMIADTQYWAYVTNANASPTTIFPTYQLGAVGTGTIAQSGGINSFVG